LNFLLFFSLRRFPGAI